ncbi:MAG: antitoxin Xre/MbcA/ParS toxin-binding domain-containing protein [Fimbriiglobus sp.]
MITPPPAITSPLMDSDLISPQVQHWRYPHHVSLDLELIRHFEKLGFPEAELSQIFAVGIPKSSDLGGILGVRTQQNDLARNLDQLFQQCVETLDEPSRAISWICRPSQAFAGRKPWQVLSELGGLEKLITYLLQAEHGVYS